MKKKGLIAIIASIAAAFVICMTVGVYMLGRNQGNTSDGTIGTPIEVVYAQAQDLGFEGTLEEFLILVQGEKGDTGIGISVVEIVEGELVITYTDGTSTNLGKIIGSDGSNGENG